MPTSNKIPDDGVISRDEKNKADNNTAAPCLVFHAWMTIEIHVDYEGGWGVREGWMDGGKG